MSKTNKEELRGFYADLVSYIIVNIFLFLLWTLTAGPYWPIWVVVIWGAVLLVQAAHVGFVPQTGLTMPFLKLFPFLKSVFPFLEDDWKEADLSETSKAIASKLEEVGLETAKSASKTATRVAEQTMDVAHELGEKTAKTAKKSGIKAVKKTASTAKKTVKRTTKKAKKVVKKPAKTSTKK